MKYYVIATNVTSGKVVAFPAKGTPEECEEDIVKYDKMDNKSEIRFTYEIASPIERKKS